jgi:Transposase, Mutator family
MPSWPCGEILSCRTAATASCATATDRSAPFSGIGPVEVRRAKVRDRGDVGAADKIRFTSSILPKWARRTKSLDALLPILYLRGVSTGDFQEALTALLGKDAPNLSPAVITPLTAEWEADYDARQKRDLSARRYVYVWADGVYLQARMEESAECMLVLIGATPEGKKELIGFQTGVRESTQSWRELLIDIRRRGLEIAPDLAVGDGALGFWKAIDEVFPNTRHQRDGVQARHRGGKNLAAIEGRKPVAESRPRSQIPKRHRGHRDVGSPRRLIDLVTQSPA